MHPEQSWTILDDPERSWTILYIVRRNFDNPDEFYKERWTECWISSSAGAKNPAGFPETKSSEGKKADYFRSNGPDVMLLIRTKHSRINESI